MTKTLSSKSDKRHALESQWRCQGAIDELEALLRIRTDKNAPVFLQRLVIEQMVKKLKTIRAHLEDEAGRFK